MDDVRTPGGPIARPDLRASDRDREGVATRLREAMEDGRLDADEYEQRLTTAYAAKTFGELAPLTADLGSPPPASPGESESSDEPGSSRRRQPQHWRQWLATAVLLNVIWGITCVAAGELIFYWPIFPLGIWGATLVASLVGGPGWNGGRDDRRRLRAERRDERRRGIEPPA